MASTVDARRLLPVLLLLSGFSGIAYEILYVKILGNLLGNQFTVNAIVLVSFLLGIGLGAVCAFRFMRWLWAFEAGIGLYAALVIVSYGQLEMLLFETLPALGAGVPTSALLAFVVLLVPAFLIGCSLPLFAAYIASLRLSHAFSRTYAIYNIGGVLTALSVEFVLLRTLGLKDTTLLLAALNVSVAAAILILIRTTPLMPAPPPEHYNFPRRILAALALASIASAVFQLLMLKLSEFIFGPYNESFSLVLANVLLGLAIGSAVATRAKVTFEVGLLFCLGGLAFTLAFLPNAVSVYAWLHARAVVSYHLVVTLKFALLFVLMAAPAIGFGIMIPALLKRYRHIARESGQLLFVSSLSNVVGFLLMGFVLHRHLDYGALLLLVAVMVVAAVLVHAGWRRRISWSAVSLLGLAALLYRGYWDEMALYVGYTSFRSLGNFEEARQNQGPTRWFKGAHDVFAIVGPSNESSFFINGYYSVGLNSSTERVLGALSSMLAPRTDDALVLGVGTGATAGTVGRLFERTDAIEISKPIIDNLHQMAQYNFDIARQPNVRLVNDDALRFVNTSKKQYSLVLNTATTPRYYSSSKLYTVEFLDAVRRRLAPDGVYVTWVDRRVGEDGIGIVLDTLASAFDDCWLGQLAGFYVFFACSDGPLRFSQLERVVHDEAIARHLAETFTIPVRFLPYSIVSSDVLALRSRGALSANTLDFPILEFEMARMGPAGSLKNFMDQVWDAFDAETMKTTVGQSMPWRLAEFSLFADLQGFNNAEANDLEPLLGAVSGSDYDRAALTAAREIGTADGYYLIGELLNKRGRYDAAVLALSQVLSMSTSRGDAHYLLGESHFHLAAYERALVHFRNSWILDKDRRVPLSAARTLNRIGRYVEALEWLQTAEALSVGEPDASYHRGIAHEGLNAPQQARHFYELVLEMDPGHALARTALEQL